MKVEAIRSQEENEREELRAEVSLLKSSTGTLFAKMIGVERVPYLERMERRIVELDMEGGD